MALAEAGGEAAAQSLRQCRPPYGHATSQAVFGSSGSPPAREQSGCCPQGQGVPRFRRSEEHTSELQSLMRISYAVFCLKKKKNNTKNINKKQTVDVTKIASINMYITSIYATRNQSK